MARQNIVYQVVPAGGDTWADSKIVHCQLGVEDGYNYYEIAMAISTVLGYKTVRVARLNEEEQISVQVANNHSGDYHQAYPLQILEQ